MAELESRTVSNMARVLIQQGVQRHEQELEASAPEPTREERLRSALESQHPRHVAHRAGFQLRHRRETRTEILRPVSYTHMTMPTKA